MRLSQFCKNELQAQYSFIYQIKYIAKKYNGKIYIYIKKI